MSGGGAMFWGEMAQLMHNATVDYGKMAYGIWSDHKARKMQRAAFDYQKQYDRNAIQWRVADAKAAGLHPLAALGAQTTSAVQNVFDGQGGRLNASGVPPMDFSKYSKMALEQGRLQNEQMRLQNEQIRLKNEAMSAKHSDDKSKTSVARKDGFTNALKSPPSGVDQPLQNLLSFSRRPDGSLDIQPSKDVNTDDFGAAFSYPRYYFDKWIPAVSDIDAIEKWLNDPRSEFYKDLKPGERWVSNWSFGSGNHFVKRKISNFDLYKFKRSRYANDPRYVRGKGRVKYNPVDRYNLHLKSKYKDY